MNKRPTLYFIGAILLHIITSQVTSEVPLCSDTEASFKGYYTYTIDKDTGEKVWSHCKFPTPVNDHALCGRTMKDGAYFLCDPDGLLGSTAHDSIDHYLYNIQTNTSTICVSPTGDKQSYIVALLLINRIRIPDLNSVSLCQNDCTEYYPEANQDNQTPTEDQQNEIMKNFADSVRTLWALGACDNDVLVLYCRQFNKIYISAGSRATKHLTTSKIESLTETFQNDLNNNNDFETSLLEAIANLTNSLRIVLRATTFAHLLMIANLVLVCLFGIWFYYYLFVRQLETNVWGQEKPVEFLEFCFQFVTGIWFIKTMMAAFSMMSDSKTGLMIAFIVTGTAFILCCVLYGVSVTTYHGY